MERRVERKERRNLSSHTLSTQLQHIATQATADPDVVFHNIVHHIDETLRGEAFQRLRKGKKKATGIDGQTAAEYAQDVRENLCDLHECLKTGRFSQKLRGDYQYFGRRGNYDSIFWVYDTLRFAWRRWLSRRSQKGRITWDTCEKILARFPLPKPHIVQKWV